MSKLSFEALSKRADEVVSQELLQSISGGTEDSCHDDPPPPPTTQGPCIHENADTSTPGDGSAHAFLQAGNAIAHWLYCEN